MFEGWGEGAVKSKWADVIGKAVGFFLGNFKVIISGDSKKWGLSNPGLVLMKDYNDRCADKSIIEHVIDR